jgi:hypothetical protein
MAEEERNSTQAQLHAQQQQGQRTVYERALEAWQQKREATQASIADSQTATQAMKHELKERQVCILAICLTYNSLSVHILLGLVGKHVTEKVLQARQRR